MKETEVALALSARGWSDDLHRFLADHGGARVRVTAMGQEDLIDEAFDVLLIDDICSFLTPRLIHIVKASGRQVVGVYDPVEFADGKDRLLECGVADVVEADADPDEFLRVINRVAEWVSPTDVSDAASPPMVRRPDRSERKRQQLIAVGGPGGGVGVTEVSVAVAHLLGEAGRSVVLLDADDQAPSVAQRLGLSLYPNLRTAIDITEQRTAPVTTVVQPVRRFGVVAGLPNAVDWAEVRPSAVTDLALELTDVADHVVANLGRRVEAVGFEDTPSRLGISKALLQASDRVIAVGLSTPVGVARLLDWLSGVKKLSEGRSVDILMNRAPRDQFRRGELIEELTRTYRPSSLTFLPDDDQVGQAAWDGTVVGRGRFSRAVGRWVTGFLSEPAA